MTWFLRESTPNHKSQKHLPRQSHPNTNLKRHFIHLHHLYLGCHCNTSPLRWFIFPRVGRVSQVSLVSVSAAAVRGPDLPIRRGPAASSLDLRLRRAAARNSSATWDPLVFCHQLTLCCLPWLPDCDSCRSWGSSSEFHGPGSRPVFSEKHVKAHKTQKRQKPFLFARHYITLIYYIPIYSIYKGWDEIHSLTNCKTSLNSYHLDNEKNTDIKHQIRPHR